jgi:hypothetical protein
MYLLLQGIFTKKLSISSHSKTFTGGKPYRCSECLHTFPQLGRMGTRMRNHIRGTPCPKDSLVSSVSDPHRLYADPDPAFLLNADPDPTCRI